MAELLRHRRLRVCALARNTFSASDSRHARSGRSEPARYVCGKQACRARGGGPPRAKSTGATGGGRA